MLMETAIQAETTPRTFDWRKCWYPVALVEDLPQERPTAFSIHALRLVLFRLPDGTLGCLQDRCPHRAARLSDGHIVDGRLECLYHGWQFDEEGRCVWIPQLQGDSEIPDRAHVRSYAVVERQGIVWVWAGEPTDAAREDIPAIPDLDRAGFSSIDFMMDLPYGQPYLIENIIDIAHIHIAHDGIRGGGKRELASPLQFTVLENTIRGIRSTFASVKQGGVPSGPLRGASVEFVAPNLVWYQSHYADQAKASGLALYSLPLSSSRCRLIYRAYSNFPRWQDRITPRAAQHWTQCTILEQDMQVVMGQAEEIERARMPLRDLWLPIKSSDALVIQYRKWLDAHGSGIPSCQGFATCRSHASSDTPDRPGAVDRLRLHTNICASCSRAHRLAASVSAALITAVVLLLVIAVLASSQSLSATSGVAALAAAFGVFVTRRVQRRFE